MDFFKKLLKENHREVSKILPIWSTCPQLIRREFSPLLLNSVPELAKPNLPKVASLRRLEKCFFN
jgi:hypothetical protein